MQKITRIGPLSLAKLLGGIGAVFGLIFGLFFSLFSVLGFTAAAFEGAGGESLIGILFGVGALFVMPLFYGVAAFVQGLITALIANLALRLFGGLEVSIEG